MQRGEFGQHPGDRTGREQLPRRPQSQPRAVRSSIRRKKRPSSGRWPDAYTAGTATGAVGSTSWYIRTSVT